MTPENPQAQASSILTDADVDIALLEDTVSGQQAIEIADNFQKTDHTNCQYPPPVPAAGSWCTPPGRHIGGMHASAAGTLIELHELFAFFETPQRRSQRQPTSSAWVVTLSKWDRMRPISE